MGQAEANGLEDRRRPNPPPFFAAPFGPNLSRPRPRKKQGKGDGYIVRSRKTLSEPLGRRVSAWNRRLAHDAGTDSVMRWLADAGFVLACPALATLFRG